MNPLSLKIADGTTAFEPGASIAVDVAWHFERPPRSVELRTVWNTDGKGDADFEVVDTMPFDAPAAVEKRRIALTLPRAPYSFVGRLIRLIWALELVTAVDTARLEIIIAPQGKPVELPWHMAYKVQPEKPRLLHRLRVRRRHRKPKNDPHDRSGQ